jgi:rRNA small subunit pseudouridine methyltransferase Nep1
MSGMKRKSIGGPQKGKHGGSQKKVKAEKPDSYEASNDVRMDSSEGESSSDDENINTEKTPLSVSQTASSSSTKKVDDDSDDDDIYDPALAGMKKSGTGVNHQQILVILDLASLETVKTKKGDFQLLNCDDHIGLIRKFRKDPNEYRPDIIHQELMAVLDSPLNKAGRVRVIVHTEKNVLFEVSPKTRIPRTFKRFSGLMVQLLHKLKIRSSDGKDMLLKVVKNPISRHIPAGAKVIGFSHLGNLTSPLNVAKALPAEGPIVLLFGAQATKGIAKENHPYVSHS